MGMGEIIKCILEEGGSVFILCRTIAHHDDSHDAESVLEVNRTHVLNNSLGVAVWYRLGSGLITSSRMIWETTGRTMS